MPQNLANKEVNIGTGNGLVPSGKLQQAITQANADSDLCCHMVSLSHR